MALIPKGFKCAGVRCGLKTQRKDVGILLSEVPTASAGLFTTNFVRASSVDFSRAVVRDGKLRAVVVNSGNANCCTGTQGERDTARMAQLTAAGLGLEVDQVAVSSTGVIGHLLDMSKVEKGIEEASRSLGDDPAPFMDAILTTDLVEKWARLSGGSLTWTQSPVSDAPESGGPVVYGVCKGSGMMAPNMATMLAYVVTDYDATGYDLQAMLKRVADKSFNCMTVDGDTSTNDSVILMTNGASGVRPSEGELEEALTTVCVSLAKQIARDGEGATKLVEVHVTGTGNPMKIARTIGESPLVKTAMFGCDPNWGRILMAAGRAGVPFDACDILLKVTAQDKEFTLFEAGHPGAFDRKRVSTALKSDHVVIDLSLGAGDTATVYTCDFGYGYVRINAEYHT